jgi:hypothetical protein
VEEALERLGIGELPSTVSCSSFVSIGASWSVSTRSWQPRFFSGSPMFMNSTPKLELYARSRRVDDVPERRELRHAVERAASRPSRRGRPR